MSAIKTKLARAYGCGCRGAEENGADLMIALTGDDDTIYDFTMSEEMAEELCEEIRQKTAENQLDDDCVSLIRSPLVPNKYAVVANENLYYVNAYVYYDGDEWSIVNLHVVANTEASFGDIQDSIEGNPEDYFPTSDDHSPVTSIKVQSIERVVSDAGVFSLSVEA
jgi:hypothetical protein